MTMKKPESIVEECDNCGEEGYGKAWYGKGAPNDPHGYGDAYYPTGSAVYCSACAPAFAIGREWNGEEIWKKTSDFPQDEASRVRQITKVVNKEYNVALNDVLTLLDNHE